MKSIVFASVLFVTISANAAVDYTATQTVQLAPNVEVTCSNISAQFGLGAGSTEAAPARLDSLTFTQDGRTYYCRVATK